MGHIIIRLVYYHILLALIISFCYSLRLNKNKSLMAFLALVFRTDLVSAFILKLCRYWPINFNHCSKSYFHKFWLCQLKIKIIICLKSISISFNLSMKELCWIICHSSRLLPSKWNDIFKVALFVFENRRQQIFFYQLNPKWDYYLTKLTLP